jgi:hypothetical protein
MIRRETKSPDFKSCQKLFYISGGSRASSQSPGSCIEMEYSYCRNKTYVLTSAYFGFAVVDASKGKAASSNAGSRSPLFFQPNAPPIIVSHKPPTITVQTSSSLGLRELLRYIIKLGAALQLRKSFFLLAVFLTLNSVRTPHLRPHSRRRTRICRTFINCAPLTLPPFSSSSALPLPFPFAAPPLSAALPFGAIL